MFLQVFSDNPFATNCWLLGLEDREEAVVVDPGFEPDRVRRLLERAGRRAVAALATHGHVDHVGAAAALCGDGIPFYIHEADRLALEDPEAWGAGFPHDPVPVEDVRTLVEGEALELAGMGIEVLHTPGHTPGSVCFRIGDLLLLSGDLVFAGSIGRSDFPNSSPQDMRRSLVRFLALPDPLPVLPGHGARTTVGKERRSNPFLVGLV